LLEHQLHLTRRQLFGRAATGIGLAALATLLGEDRTAHADAPAASGALPELPHFASKARRVIYLMQGGAPSRAHHAPRQVFPWAQAVLLNNDRIVPLGWLHPLIAQASMSFGTGLVGPISNYAAPPQLVETFPYRVGPKKGSRVQGGQAEWLVDTEAVHAFAQQFREQHKGKWCEAERLLPAAQAGCPGPHRPAGRRGARIVRHRRAQRQGAAGGVRSGGVPRPVRAPLRHLHLLPRRPRRGGPGRDSISLKRQEALPVVFPPVQFRVGAPA
jgi:hypothetical protein